MVPEPLPRFLVRDQRYCVSGSARVNRCVQPKAFDPTSADDHHGSLILLPRIRRMLGSALTFYRDFVLSNFSPIGGSSKGYAPMPHTHGGHVGKVITM